MNSSNMSECIHNIREKQNITYEEMTYLLSCTDEDILACLKNTAREVADSIYGKDIYIRGLIEFTNICKNDCYYCGIRRSNCNVNRYRLTAQEILECAEEGYRLGFRTFVLQGGEDMHYTDECLCDIISAIKKKYPYTAVTLSIGERSKESYKAYFDAGADRYLLRHETADEAHYKMLHPDEMSYDNRIKCLETLKETGYQVGCGFMVGSPWQTTETLYKDLMLIKKLKPQMVGIGPFIPHHDTPFADKKAGTLEMTLRLLSIIRLLHPHVLLPATTALGTIDAKGREMGILAGANVVMPNLSPGSIRKDYQLYDNKICTGDEAAECIECLGRRMAGIGYRIVSDRGNPK